MPVGLSSLVIILNCHSRQINNLLLLQMITDILKTILMCDHDKMSMRQSGFEQTSSLNNLIHFILTFKATFVWLPSGKFKFGQK